MTESFKGCMRNMVMNSSPYDILNNKAIMGVMPCYQEVERGAHFNGVGYVLYGERTSVFD